MPQKLQIRYFAQLKEERGCDSEIVDTSSKTALELYEELKARHGFTLPKNVLKVAINQEFQTWDVPLKSQDEIVFIPPVAGG